MIQPVASSSPSASSSSARAKSSSVHAYEPVIVDLLAEHGEVVERARCRPEPHLRDPPAGAYRAQTERPRGLEAGGVDHEVGPAPAGRLADGLGGVVAGVEGDRALRLGQPQPAGDRIGHVHLRGAEQQRRARHQDADRPRADHEHSVAARGRRARPRAPRSPAAPSASPGRRAGPAGIGTAALAGTANRSANPPGRSRPTSRPVAQWLMSPARQSSHTPHATIGFSTTRWPASDGSTPSPVASIDADGLVAHHERRDPARARLPEAVQVRAADRRGPRRDDDLAPARLRIRRVLQLHPARPEVHERPHRRRPPRAPAPRPHRRAPSTNGCSRGGTNTGTPGWSRSTLSTRCAG